MRHNARIALALYNTSLPTEVSFIIMLVDMMTSSAVVASSFKIKYTICRKDGSLFWNNLDMPKKSVVASFVGNVSPVNRSTAILVRRVRHLRGDIGEELNSLATKVLGSTEHIVRKESNEYHLEKRRSGLASSWPDQHLHLF